MRKAIFISIAAALPAAAQGPAVRPISAPDAESPHTYGVIAGVRPLPTGTLLVNDVQKRQLTLVDQSFGNARVVVDSVSGSPNSYGSRIAMIAYVGDSSLLIDPVSRAMRILDPAGNIARTIAPPATMDMNLVGGPAGKTTADARGRLVYRGPLAGAGATPAPPGPREFPDSLPIVRTDLATGKFDTLVYIAIPKTVFKVNPIPVEDDWAFLADGSVAIVRHGDYHVDFIGADGKRSTGPKIPHDWQQLTDADKIAIVDSTKRLVASPNAPRGPNGGPLVVVEPSELPDIRPAFRYGSAFADADDNLWIQTTTPAPDGNGQVYDIVDRRGALVDRIELPLRRRIIGFGKGGIVYLFANNSGGRWIERRHR